MRHVAYKHVMQGHDELEAKPLTEPVLLILLSLAGKPQHGYALMKDIETLSEGRVHLTTGTLYGALRRLLEDVWIERFEQKDTSRDKQAYRLTALGQAHLANELQRMRQLTEIATARLKPAKEV